MKIGVDEMKNRGNKTNLTLVYCELVHLFVLAEQSKFEVKTFQIGKIVKWYVLFWFLNYI